MIAAGRGGNLKSGGRSVANAGRNRETRNFGNGGKIGNPAGAGKGKNAAAARRNGPWKWVAVSSIVLIAGLSAMASAGWFRGVFGDSPGEIAKAAGVVETADAVRIPLAALSSGKALFLRADAGGSEIHYFVLKSSDGVYRAAYDACDVCFRANRGYRQEGDLMVCNNCGQAFPSVKVNEVKGGCNPAPLTREVDGGNLVITKGDLAAGGHYFPGRRG